MSQRVSFGKKVVELMELVVTERLKTVAVRLLNEGVSVAVIVKATGLAKSTVYRYKASQGS